MGKDPLILMPDEASLSGGGDGKSIYIYTFNCGL